MGLLSSSRAIAYCGSQSWKLATLSSINTRICFSSHEKCQNNSVSGILSNTNVHMLQTTILQTRFNSTNVSSAKQAGLFSPDAAIDKTGKVNRWSMFVPAFLTHICKYVQKRVDDSPNDNIKAATI